MTNWWILPIIILILILYYINNNYVFIEHFATSPGTLIQLAANNPVYYLDRYPKSYYNDVFFTPKYPYYSFSKYHPYEYGGYREIMNYPPLFV